MRRSRAMGGDLVEVIVMLVLSLHGLSTKIDGLFGHHWGVIRGQRSLFADAIVDAGSYEVNS